MGPPAFGQCWVTLYVDSSNSDTVHICRGDSVTLSAEGQCEIINSNFNNGAIGETWQYCTPNFLFQAPCDTSQVEASYLWFGEDCVPNRTLESIDLNLTGGGDIAFNLKFGIQGQMPSCEGPDEMWEGVSVQYSIDAGSTWTNIVYFAPNGTVLNSNPNTQNPMTYWPTSFCNWNDYSFDIPVAAQTTHTRIRWIQTHCSYFNNHYDDNWGLDNIRISSTNNTGIGWGNNSSGTFAPDSTATYFVYILGQGASPDTVAMDSVTIIVHDLPDFEISGDTTICLGVNVVLLATGNYEFTWSNGSIGASFQSSLQQSTGLFVTATDYLGCQRVENVEVVVNQLPVAIAIGDTICSGSSALISVSGGSNYLWNSNQTGPSIFVSPGYSTNYFVTVTDSNGCASIAVTTVFVNPVPVSGLDDHIILCHGTPLLLQAKGGSNYNWSNGSHNPQIVVEPELSSTFFVTITNTEGCSTTDSVVVYVSPQFHAQVSSSTDSICVGQMVTLYAEGGDYYEWSNGKRSPVIDVEPEISTTYSVTITNMFEGQSCEIVRYLPVNVDDCYSVFIANAFSPKGYNNIFKPIGQLEKVTDYVFRIFDRTGKELFSTQDPYSGWDGRFNGEFVPNGVYVYMLRFMPEYGTKGVEKFGSLLIVE